MSQAKGLAKMVGQTGVFTMFGIVILLALIIDFCVGYYRYSLPPSRRGFAPPQESWQQVFKTWFFTALGSVLGIVLAVVVSSFSQIGSDAILAVVIIGIIFRTATSWRS